ncbi:MAG: acyltransferase family protein [Bdellovibrionales bacterium]|nr:acyltransferase family protein [Bdellovibrionales bacterium]
MDFAAWLEALLRSRPSLSLTPEEIQRIDEAPKNLNSAGFDDWGFHPETFKRALPLAKFLYRDYFKAEVSGIENMPTGRVLVVANHGGQLPFDGMLILTALALDAHPARIARGMVERWFPSLPFISTLFIRCGLMVGDHRNCRDLLERDECVLAFPEGVRGSGKPFAKRYQLQRFGTGFMRLALETGAPIVPVAVIGSEEMYPSIFDFKFLAKLFKFPYFPVTPTFPLLGPLGAIPLPTRVSLRFGTPLKFDLDPDASDEEVEELIKQVKTALSREIDEGLRLRGDRIFNVGRQGSEF